ncbi:S24 family peptidase [Telmatospirillum sp. J64-1]|uniref:XRE family transcriptional regulator n=1 Tax=Telmatospirillum sp. J64-1 TaxID=2502183 RepID=UPI00115E7DC5|nr:S24 family peptidase [Telmatospirillum sp. J64-1]
MEFRDRLRAVREKLGSQKAAADLVGVSVTTWQSYEAGVSEPKSSALARLCQLGINPVWLLTGLGEMEGSGETARGHVQPLGSTVKLPIYDAALSLGFGNTNGSAKILDEFDVPESYLRDHLKASSSSVVGVYMRGDSMEPTLFDGDIAIIDTSSQELRDDVYAFRLADEGYIKRLQLRGHKLLVASDNSAYPAWEIDRRDAASGLQIFGRVVGSIRKT